MNITNMAKASINTRLYLFKKHQHIHDKLVNLTNTSDVDVAKVMDHIENWLERDNLNHVSLRALGDIYSTLKGLYTTALDTLSGSFVGCIEKNDEIKFMTINSTNTKSTQDALYKCQKFASEALKRNVGYLETNETDCHNITTPGDALAICTGEVVPYSLNQLLD